MGCGAITYGRALSGFADTAFVGDALNREIIGVATHSTMCTNAQPWDSRECAQFRRPDSWKPASSSH